MDGRAMPAMTRFFSRGDRPFLLVGLTRMPFNENGAQGLYAAAESFRETLTQGDFMFFPFFSHRPLISGLSLTTGVAAAQSSKTEFSK
jgi:hypothetical protein